MKYITNNTSYFIKEVKTIIRLNPLSNILSIFSIALVLFILVLVTAGWWISSEAIEIIQKEAEISVFFDESFDNQKISELIVGLEDIEGVMDTKLVGTEEAYRQMTEILGADATVLAYFDENPFVPFIEVKINMKDMDDLLQKLGELEGIEYVRDNREVLQGLQNIERVLRLISYLVFVAVGIATLVVISHIIRSGIYNNREEILTLRLLGAQKPFIAIPFILEGVLLTLGGGILALVIALGAFKLLYNQVATPLPFIPLPPMYSITNRMTYLIIPLSIILGLAGSIFGLKSAVEG